MSLLSYTSKEMYSSTELIRKSKNIFDKLSNNEIEKAVILRDGKPNFILLDFEMYENLIIEYLSLKNKNKSSNEVSINQKVLESNKNEKKENKEKEDIDLEKALKEIENLDINISNEIGKDTNTQPLKDFWE